MLPTGGWKFIEGIREPSIKYLDAEDVENIKVYHESYLHHYNVTDDNKLVLKDKFAGTQVGLVELWYKNEKINNYMSTLIDTTIFLMNDEGRTIERIN